MAGQRLITPGTTGGSDRLARRLVDLEAVVATLRDQVAVLEDQVRGLVEDDVTLMRTLVGSVGATAFSSGELLEHARIAPELAAALRGCRRPQHVGKRLQALADRVLGGFVLRRVGRDHTGTIWAVQVADDLHLDACVDEDTGA